MALEDAVAIDVHVHVEQDVQGRLALDDELMAASAAYFRSTEDRTPTVEDIAAYYSERQMIAVIFVIDATTATGHPALSSADVISAAAAHPDVLIPFGSVDPLCGAAAVGDVARLVDAGARGFKFHPSLQAFAPDDTAFYPLFEAIAVAGVPALFHTGQTGIGAGLPGGRGIKLGYSNPMLLDAVAADFPELTIILAHPSVPWQDEAISIATHKANVFIDLSGWAPKYFPPQLIRAINGPLKRKVLFGSDFPLITPDRWLAEFAQLEIKDEVRPLVLKDNAVALLTP
jgi:predicted TIM-barrel fold metal-dependent hydrolase